MVFMILDLFLKKKLKNICLVSISKLFLRRADLIHCAPKGGDKFKKIRLKT